MKYPPFLTVRRERFLRGFTLIEVMIVFAILGILAAFAYPSYEEFILRGHRADAKASLQRAAQWMEKRATVAGTYPVAGTGFITIFNDAGLNQSEGGRYTITVSGLNLAGSTFTLTASPAGFDDPKCGSFKLTHDGTKTETGSGTTDYCWGR